MAVLARRSHSWQHFWSSKSVKYKLKAVSKLSVSLWNYLHFLLRSENMKYVLKKRNMTLLSFFPWVAPFLSQYLCPCSHPIHFIAAFLFPHSALHTHHMWDKRWILENPLSLPLFRIITVLGVWKRSGRREGERREEQTAGYDSGSRRSDWHQDELCALLCSLSALEAKLARYSWLLS